MHPQFRELNNELSSSWSNPSSCHTQNSTVPKVIWKKNLESALERVCFSSYCMCLSHHALPHWVSSHYLALAVCLLLFVRSNTQASIVNYMDVDLKGPILGVCYPCPAIRGVSHQYYIWNTVQLDGWFLVFIPIMHCFAPDPYPRQRQWLILWPNTYKAK